MKKILTMSIALMSLSFAIHGKTILTELPQQIDANDRFVFYSHGFIVEGDNPKPIETKNGWGVYNFPAVKMALADDTYTLIAAHRKKGTDPFEYSKTLSEQVRALVAAGVKPHHITLIGFSRGAFITGLTSNKLADIGVNTVLLAGCGRFASKKYSNKQVYGHVLSIYERSDRSGSCASVKKRSTDTKSFNEIAINTGLSHGAFYRPIDAWVKPSKKWLKLKMELSDD